MRDFTGMHIESLPQSVSVAKQDVSVFVEFAAQPGVLETLEGPVRYAQGDALLVGASGERWPVRRDFFLRIYAAVAPTVQGQGGIYRKVFQPVWAVRLEEDACVTVAGGHISGKPGDWLVQYGEGEYGIVAADIFAETYTFV